MSPKRLVLSSAVLLLVVGCGGGAQPPAQSAVDAKPAPSSSASASSSPSPAAVPTIEHWAFTEYQDFSGHGFKGKGRAFRHEGAKWVWAECSTSHVADPQAGASAPPTCGAWTEVPAGAVPALERLNGRSTDVMCAQEGALCKELGVTP